MRRHSPAVFYMYLVSWVVWQHVEFYAYLMWMSTEKLAEKLENFEVMFEEIVDDALNDIEEKWDQMLEYPEDVDWDVVDR